MSPSCDKYANVVVESMSRTPQYSTRNALVIMTEMGH